MNKVFGKILMSWVNLCSQTAHEPQR